MSTLLRWVAARACEDAAMSRILDSWWADYRFELASASHWPRRLWIQIVYLLSWCRLVGIVVWRSEGVPRLIAFQIGGVLILAAVFITAPFWDVMSTLGPSHRRFLVMFMAPQALVAALGFGSCVGLVAAMRRNAMTAANRFAAVSAAVVCSILILVGWQWVVPVSNQAFRVAYVNRTWPVTAPRRPIAVRYGLRETVLTELVVQARRARSQEERDQVRRELHGRLTLAAAPVALTVFLMAVVRRMRFPRLAGFLVIGAYYPWCMAYQLQWMRHSPAWMFAIAWTPTLLLLLSSILVWRGRPAVG